MTTDTWKDAGEVYSPSEVEAVLGALGIEVRDETENDFLSLCPFHGNTDSPAFSTSKVFGYSVCFNPACAKGLDRRMTLEDMVGSLKGLNNLQSKRFIRKAQAGVGGTFAEKFDAIDTEPEPLPPFSSGAIDKMHSRLMGTTYAIEYLQTRGINRDTIEHFKIGFTPASISPVYRKHDMIVVPAYDRDGIPVGLVGRSIVGKEFKNFGPRPNGTGFHKSQIIWNLNNAKRFETVIICESTFDAMRIHQAGYENVVALLGGTLSETQKFLLNRYFTSAIIFTDNENAENGGMTFHKFCSKCVRAGNEYCQGHAPGRDLGMKIANSLPRLRVSWAAYDDKVIYARNVKDATDMTKDEIVQCLRNKVSHFDYLDWTS